MNAELELFCNRLLEALFNGAYQELLLTAVIALGLKLYPRGNAATRHVVWLVTLLFVAALPVVHFFLPKLEARISRESSDDAEGVQSVTLTDFREALNAGHASVLGTETLENTGPSQPKHLLEPGETAPAEVGNHQPENGRFTDAQISLARDFGRTVQSVRFGTIPWHWQLTSPGRASVILICLWIALAFARLGSLARQCCLLHSLKRRGADAPDNLHILFETLSHETKASRKPRLIVSDECNVPMAVGFRNPAVLLPAKLCGSDAGFRLEHVLRHELAHVERRDDWTNLVQQTIKAVLFFDPAVWWLSRRLTIEREIACDDHVLAALGAPRGYALFLTEFAGRMQGRDIAAAPAAWSNKNQLKERINMILDSKRNSSPRLARGRVGVLATAGVLVAILGLQMGPRLALAADKDSKENEAEIAASARAQVAVTPAIESEIAIVQSADATDDDSAIDESGPRPKPQPLPEVPHAPRAVAVAPVPPLGGPVNALPTLAVRVTPNVAIAPMLAAPAAAGSAAQAASDGPPKRKRSADDSIERRLERLERLVESLMAREKGPKARTDVQPFLNFKGPTLDGFDKDKFAKLADDLAKMGGKFDAQAKAAAKLAKPNEQELARIKEQAERIKEHAKRDADKVLKDVERATRDAQLRAKINPGEAAEARTRESLEHQRQALEAQRNSLEKQMKAVQRQIQQLEQEHKKIDEQRADEEKRVKKVDRQDDSSKQDKSDGDEKPKRK